MERQVGQHHAEAARQRPDHRLPLPMGQAERVKQHEPRTGARLPVGHPRPVAVVIEAQSHTWIVPLRAAARARPLCHCPATIGHPMAHRPVDPQASFPNLELEVLDRWRQRDVFAESLRRREGAPSWGFYEGPPTANGPPGAHHVLARVFKDIFPRYKTMCGYYVERKGGWDCHGLPVELAVEEELGFSSKADIERFGIAEFNARCRETVLSHVEDWNRLTERIGFWIDLEDAYRTLDPPYIESVWWALKTIYENGLLYEELKVVPYCPRDETTLSSHELGQPGVYRDVIDPSVYVRLPVVEDHGPARQGDELIVWTTTPWTLVSNAAVAVDPELTYVRARTGDGRVAIVAEAPLERVLGAGAEVVERFRGEALVGARYEPPFDFIAGSEYGPKGHTRGPWRLRVRRGGHGPRPHGDRVRRGRLPPRGAAGLGGDQSGFLGRYIQSADRPVRRSLGQGRGPRPDRGSAPRAVGCFAPRPTSTPIPTAGAAGRRCSITPSRPGSSPPAGSRTACWPPTRPSPGIPSTSSTAASESGSRATSTGRSRASATGGRRCRSGAARRVICTPSGRWRSCASSRASPWKIRTGRSWTACRSPAPTAARR